MHNFSLAALKSFFSLCIFHGLMSEHGFLWFCLFWSWLDFLTHCVYDFCHTWDVFSHCICKLFRHHTLLSWDSDDMNGRSSVINSETSRLHLFFWKSFFLCCSDWKFSIICLQVHWCFLCIEPVQRRFFFLLWPLYFSFLKFQFGSISLLNLSIFYLF